MGATSGAEIAYQSEHLNTPLVFDVVGIVQSLIFRVLSFHSFSFSICIVYPSVYALICSEYPNLKTVHGLG